ncbi:MAG: hypothetical protein QXR45_15160 [Candidatus Bathyarchaeia archaeon]
MINTSKKSFIIHLLVFSFLFLAAFCIVWSFFSSRALPWWVDGGLWLKYANGILGVDWPMWQESPLNYPPLFPSLLTFMIITTSNPVFSVKLLAAVVFALRSSIAYISSWMIFKSKMAALASSIIFLVLPLHVEILGWGGYPNLLALSLMMLAFASLISWIRDGSIKNMILVVILSALIALGHNLSFLVYFTALIILLFASLCLKVFKSFYKIFIISIVSVGIYALYLLAFLWPPSYVLNNEAAFFHLRLNLSTGLLTWMFKNSGFLIILYILMSFTIIMSVFIKNKLIEVAVLSAWLVSPLFLINLHEFGVALDYYRIFYFFADPFVLLASGSGAFIFGPLPNVKDNELLKLKMQLDRLFKHLHLTNFRRLLSVIMLLILVIAIASSLYFGIKTIRDVEGWYNYRDKYGDVEKLEAVEWIKQNTPKESVFVAEEEIARWIEGVASRRVLMYAHPMYLFVKGEHERAMMSKFVLLSSISLTNGKATLYEPADAREKVSTRIGLKCHGAIEEVLYFESNSSYVEGWSDEGRFIEFFTDAKNIQVTQENSNIIVTYFLEHFIVKKIISVSNDSFGGALYFKVSSTLPDIYIDKLVIELKTWPYIALWNVKVEPPKNLILATSICTIFIETNSSRAFPFIFNGEDSHSIGGYVKVSVREESESRSDSNVQVIRAADVLKSFGAKYIVIPRIQAEKPYRNVSLEPITIPEYMHLLHDPNYRIVYQNARVIILEFQESE